MNIKQAVAGGLFCLLAVSAIDARADSDPLDTARQALARRDATRAVAVLQPLEAQRAGDPAFDYLLGVALLDAGDPQRAIFALERVLALQPHHAQARAEIGRAYLMTGERKLALQELDTVRGMNIPEDAQRTIDQYLSAFGAGPTRLSGYLETTVGHDTNVNSATAATRVTIFNTFEAILTPSSRRHAADFFGVAGGFNYNKPLNESTALVAEGGFARNFVLDSGRFDTQTINGSVGLRWSSGRHALSWGLTGQTFSVSDQRNRDAMGSIGQWQYQLDPSSQLSLYVQYVQFSYPDQHLRDANRTVAGVAYAKRFAGEYAPNVYVSAYGGRERETADNVPHLGHTPVGLRFGGHMNLSSTTQLFAHAAIERRRYGGEDPFFLVRRRDVQSDVRIGMKYEPWRYWSVIPSISHTKNESNARLYDYARTIYAISVRREF